MSWDEAVTTAVTETIRPLAFSNLEDQKECNHLQSMLQRYLNQASKKSTWQAPWQDLVQEFSDKFFASMWASLGERPWVDKLDFATPIHAALLCYCRLDKKVADGSIAADEFMECVVRTAESCTDVNRFYSSRHAAVEKVITSKALQKRIRNVLDVSRDETVRENHPTAEGFLSSWVTRFVQELVRGEIGLTQEDALKLFNELIYGAESKQVGLPLRLQAAGEEKPGGSHLDAVSNSLAQAYTAYPQVAIVESGGGKGVDKNDRRGKGGGRRSSPYETTSPSPYGNAGLEAAVGGVSPAAAADATSVLTQYAAALGIHIDPSDPNSAVQLQQIQLLLLQQQQQQQLQLQQLLALQQQQQ